MKTKKENLTNAKIDLARQVMEYEITFEFQKRLYQGEVKNLSYKSYTIRYRLFISNICINSYTLSY